jgi:tetratricopeptide (TPR) repeat protein
MGYTYFYLNNSDSAYYYIQEALKFAEKTKDSIHLTDLIHTDLALFYEGKGEYEKGIQELQKVKENNPSIYFNKGSLFMELQQYDSARYYLLLSSDCDYIYTQAASYACLSDLETIRGNHEKSNFYLKKYDELHDSIDNDSRMAEIKTITHKYNIQTAVAQLKTKQRIKIGIILAFSVFLLLVTIGIFIIGDKKKKIKHQVQEKKILDLQSQILLTQNTILKRQQVQPEVNNQKDPDQKELNILQNQIDDLQCKMFRMKPIYATIQQLVKQERTPKEEKKILKFQDRQILKEEIYICFSEFINKLKEACPSIKEEDIELCCLSKLGLPLTVICLCFGVQETDSIRQRKYQLKKRMREHKCLELFYSAFEHKNDHK